MLLVLITFSCTKDVDCRLERLEIIENFDNQIEQADGHEAEIGYNEKGIKNSQN